MRKYGAARLFFIVFLFVVSSCGKQTVVLENRFAKGEKACYRLSIKGEGLTRLDGLGGGAGQGIETPTAMDMELDYCMEVKSVDASGIATLDTHFKRFVSRTKTGDLDIHIEGDDKGVRLVQGGMVVNDAPGLDALRRFMGQPVAMTMNKRGEILSVKGDVVGKPVMPNVDIVSMMKQSRFILPPGAVSPGDSWEDKRGLFFGEGLQEQVAEEEAVQLETVYTLDRITSEAGSKRAIISVSGEVTGSNIEMSLPGGMGDDSSAMLKPVFERLDQSMTGSIEFDIDKGVLRKTHLDSRQELKVGMNRDGEKGGGGFSSETSMKLTADIILLNE
jgi:hypothetical protein